MNTIFKLYDMKLEIFEKLNTLPPERQAEAEDFIEYLISKYGKPIAKSESLAEMRKKNMGWAKGKIWIADDFNDTPEDFKEYL